MLQKAWKTTVGNAPRPQELQPPSSLHPKTTRASFRAYLRPSKWQKRPTHATGTSVQACHQTRATHHPFMTTKVSTTGHWGHQHLPAPLPPVDPEVLTLKHNAFLAQLHMDGVDLGEPTSDGSHDGALFSVRASDGPTGQVP